MAPHLHLPSLPNWRPPTPKLCLSQLTLASPLFRINQRCTMRGGPRPRQAPHQSLRLCVLHFARDQLQQQELCILARVGADGDDPIEQACNARWDGQPLSQGSHPHCSGLASAHPSSTCRPGAPGRPQPPGSPTPSSMSSATPSQSTTAAQVAVRYHRRLQKSSAHSREAPAVMPNTTAGQSRGKLVIWSLGYGHLPQMRRPRSGTAGQPDRVA